MFYGVHTRGASRESQSAAYTEDTPTKSNTMDLFEYGLVERGDPFPHSGLLVSPLTGASLDAENPDSVSLL